MRRRIGLLWILGFFGLLRKLHRPRPPESHLTVHTGCLFVEGQCNLRDEEWADRPRSGPESRAPPRREGSGALYQCHRLPAHRNGRAAGRTGDARARATQRQ